MGDEYGALTPFKSFGGPEGKLDGTYFLSQSQHVLANSHVILVSMLANRNIRVLGAKDGAHKNDVSKQGFQDSQFEMAAGLCFYKDDEILVADLNGNKILAFSRTDFSFIGLPLSKYEFDKPNCIRTDSDNNIYVGEVGDKSRRLRCFDVHLNEKFSITTAGDYEFLGVNYVSCDLRRNRILITDSDANGVHFYTADGVYESSICRQGSALGELIYPTGTAVDGRGNVLICDTGNSRMQVFDRNGKFLAMFGGKDTFTSPMDVYIADGEGEGKGEGKGEVVVVDGSVFSGWSRVQLFKY